MPTYLCHGFRWHRRSVLGYIARHDIDDGAPEWVIAPRSEAALVRHFHAKFNFLPPLHRPASRHNNPSSSSSSRVFHKRNLSHSNDCSHVSRASSGEYYPDDPRHPNGSGSRTRSESISQQSNASQGRPRTSRRSDEIQTSAPTPLLLSPSLTVASKASDYFDNDHNNNNNNNTHSSPSPIKLLEEFDPTDESRANGPWAYVADHVVRVTTSVSVADEMFRYEARMKQDPHRAMQRGPSDEYGRKVAGAGSKRKAGWLEKLRDQLQRGESIRWYVVVCGDEERYNPTAYRDTGEQIPEEDEEEEYVEDEECEEEFEEEGGGGGGGGRGGERGSNDSSAKSPRDRTWMRQSQSTQFTEDTITTTTTTSSSVIENGFEYRIPELAGFGARSSSSAQHLLPLRKRDKPQLPPSPSLPQQPQQPPPPPPPKLPPQRQEERDDTAIAFEPTSPPPPPPPPPNSFLSPDSTISPHPGSLPSRARSRSTAGLRKLFSRQKPETQVQ
ncbi:hypothetical protein F5Y17DRAFT_119816 [Xylariaceae sp. FL0594]|nr:hypothetical protein F5Y17DRAFT_119816 [Xylariaceae sp. FL0594]